MNKCVKEFVYQAEKVSRQAVVDSKYKTSFNDIFNEKFAELIVKECANVAKYDENPDKEIWVQIKEHFGVE